MNQILPFENSINECHYIGDAIFIVFNKKQQCYITHDALSVNIKNAQKFRGYKNIDEKHNTIIVFNDDGEFFIDKNGRIIGPYDFIGSPCSEGTRPVKEIKDGVIMWGYLLPEINPKKKPKLFPCKKNDSFFVATKVGGYKVNGYEFEDRKYQWLIGFNRGKHNSSKKIIGIYHSEFIPFTTTNMFFMGLSENAHGKQIFTIYRANKKENEFGLQSLERPYSSPDSYSDVVYLGGGRFKVTQISGFISILYFDTIKKEFVYLPETDRRAFSSYIFKDHFVIAEKENSDLSILHKHYGDLTTFWENVNINGETINYLFNNKEYSTNFKNLIEAYNQSIAIIKRSIHDNDIPKVDTNNEICVSNIAEQDNLLALDWVVLLKKHGIRKSFNKDYEISVSRKLLNAPKRRKLQNGDRVAIINTHKDYLLYGAIKNILLSSKYYSLTEVEYKSIKKDFTIFQTILSKGHFFIGSTVDENMEEAIYNILKKELNISETNQDIFI